MMSFEILDPMDRMTGMLFFLCATSVFSVSSVVKNTTRTGTPTG
jgi:hypothetical protein